MANDKDREKGKSWFETYVYDPRGSSGGSDGRPPSGSPRGLAPTQVRADLASLSRVPAGSQAAEPATGSAKVGTSCSEDEAGLTDALNKGVKPGFSEFVGAYMDSISEGIEAAKAAAIAVKLLARQGISLPEIQLAFLERIEILSEERRMFNEFIDKAAADETERINGQLISDQESLKEKSAEIDRLRAEVTALEGRIAANSQSITKVNEKKGTRVADFMATFEKVGNNVKEIKKILDNLGGGSK